MFSKLQHPLDLVYTYYITNFHVNKVFFQNYFAKADNFV